MCFLSTPLHMPESFQMLDKAEEFLICDNLGNISKRSISMNLKYVGYLETKLVYVSLSNVSSNHCLITHRISPNENIIPRPACKF